MTIVIKICKICGKEFDARGKALTCSSKCSKINDKNHIREWHKNNKEYMKKYNKKWREENPEYHKKYNKKYYEENKEHTREYGKKYYQDNKEYIKKYNKKWRKENREHIRKYKKKWREDNPEYHKKYNKEYNVKIINELQQKILENGILTLEELELDLKNLDRRYYKRELQIIEYNQNYDQSYYKDFVTAVKQRANGYCELTGKKTDKGVVHHLYNYSNHIWLGVDPHNGIYLDKDIHKRFHKAKGYNCTPDDFIDFCHEEGYKVPQLVFDLKSHHKI